MRPYRLFVVTTLGASCLILEGERDREETGKANPPIGALPKRKIHQHKVSSCNVQLDKKAKMEATNNKLCIYRGSHYSIQSITESAFCSDLRRGFCCDLFYYNLSLIVRLLFKVRETFFPQELLTTKNDSPALNE